MTAVPAAATPGTPSGSSGGGTPRPSVFDDVNQACSLGRLQVSVEVPEEAAFYISKSQDVLTCIVQLFADKDPTGSVEVSTDLKFNATLVSGEPSEVTSRVQALIAERLPQCMADTLKAFPKGTTQEDSAVQGAFVAAVRQGLAPVSFSS